MTFKSVLKKTGKIILYITGGIVVLLIALWFFLKTEYAKNLIRDKAQAYLMQKIKTKVVIGNIDYSLPDWIIIKDIFIEDEQKDTLLYAGKLYVDIQMLKLIHGETYVNKIYVDSLRANITRSSNDSDFNFRFLVDAFAGKKDEPQKPVDTSALKITLKEFTIEHSAILLKDDYGGSSLETTVKSLDVTMDRFQPDKFIFDVDKMKADGLRVSMLTYRPGDTISVKVDTTSSAKKNSLQLVLKDADFRDVNILMENKLNDFYYNNSIQHFTAGTVKADLATTTISLDHIGLDSSFIKLITPKPQQQSSNEAAASAQATPWRFQLKSLKMSNDRIQFDDNKNPAQKEGLDPAHLDLQNIDLNVADIFYTSDSTKVLINQLSFKDKSGFVLDTTHMRIFYSSKDIAAAELYIKTPQSIIQNSLEIKYDSIAAITTAPQRTSLDVNLDHTDIAINDIYMLLPFVKKYMPEDKFRNNMIHLSTKISGTLKELNIPILQVQGLSGSMINAKATLYNVTDSEKLGYDIYVYNSHILKNDMVKFASSNKNINNLPPVLDISTHLKGDLKRSDAVIQFNSASLKMDGRASILNIKDTKKLSYDIDLKQFMVQKSFIMAFAPPGSMPTSIQLPDVITLKGKAKGDMNNVSPDLVMGGSYGTVSAKGYVHNFKNKSSATYDLQMTTNDFAAGKLLKQDSVLGNISMSFTAKGRGFDYKTMQSTFDMEVQNAVYQKYPYKDISVIAALDAGQLSSNGHINSNDIRMQYQASANVSQEYPTAVDAAISLDTLRMQPLGFYKDTLDAAFKAIIKAADLNPKKLNASILIDSTRMNVRSKPYALDSIKLNATTANGEHNIDLNSPFIVMNANGKFDYDKIGQSILQYIDRYYNVTSASPEKLPAQSITIKGIIKDHPIITDLSNGLTFDEINFDGGYSSGGGDSALRFNMKLPKISYQQYLLSNAKFNVSSLNSEIDYALKFDQLRLDKNIYYATSIKGDLANDSLNIAVLTKDQKNRDWFSIGAGISSKGNAYAASLKNDLILNYQKWSVDRENKIDYSPEGILADHVIITSAAKKISIQSKEKKPNSPIDINIEHFPIEDILAIANRDTLLASGDLNAKLTLSALDKTTPEIEGTAAVSQLKFKQQLIGDVDFSAKEQGENVVNVALGLSGNKNAVTAKGAYYLNDNNNQFDIDLNVDSLNMATVQAFSAGYINRASGNIKGKIKLNGNFSEPQWNGDIDFDSTRFTVATTGASYSVIKQKITFAYPDIQLDKFTIKDSAGNALTVDGSMTAQSMTDYDLSLDINAKNFILVNTQQTIDNQLYGFAAINSNVNISGSSTAPDIEGDISLNKKSDVTIVLPQQTVNKDEAKKVVRFIDRDTFALPEHVAFSEGGDTAKIDKSGFLNYNLNISVNKEAVLTVVIDPTTGDELKVQGDAKLNAGVDPGGNIVLAGNYELENGHYITSFQFLQREFNLVKGSTIAFSGNPMDAEVNITAEYIANTSASDLLLNQVSETDPATLNTFNQKIPFRVLLYLKGTMKKPDISFDIQMPDENSNIAISSELRSTIENKLAQMRSDVAVVNKEVFSLLLLGHFVSEQSSDFFKSSGSSTSMNEVARESVSKFLSSALNGIAADLFNGVNVDLNLNSYEDFSSGSEQQKTDLNVAVSKNFLNDRLTVIAGKNFGVEGEDAAAKAVQQNSTTSSFPDVTLNYKLTPNGKYLLRAYKRDQFEVTVDGYVVETGLGFVLTMDYDKFIELFHNKKNKKK